MSARKLSFKRLMWGGLTLGLAAGVGWWTWVRAKLPAITPSKLEATAFVRVAGEGSDPSDQVLRERAELFDPTPLFFPTAWNYGQKTDSGEMKRVSAEVFAEIDPQFAFAEASPKFYGSKPAPITETLVDVLAKGSGVPFAGIGQVDVERSPLPVRSGFVEVFPFNGIASVIQEPLVNLVLPRTDFSPVEFVLLVNSVGAVGEPVLASGSGVEEVDIFFRNYLVKTFRIGQRLLPGRYRVIVGP